MYFLKSPLLQKKFEKNDYIHVLNRKYVNLSIVILKITFAAILGLQICLCEILFYDSSYFITYEIVFEHIWSCNLHYFIYKLLCNCGFNQKTFIRKINRNCNEPSWLSEKHRVFYRPPDRGSVHWFHDHGLL